MNIGEFKIVNGRIIGWIATRTIDLPKLGLRKVDSAHAMAPVFEILALNVGNRWVQIGALWEAVAKNTTGELFLQGSIDDPSLGEPLPIALFGNEEEGYRVAWRRKQPRDAFGPSRSADSGRDYSPRGEGGFGGSTAGDDGGLMEAGTSLDQEIPFA